MAVAEPASPARRQVAALRELQRASADGPTAPPQLAAQLVAVNLSLFKAFTAAEEAWRDEVFRGTAPPDARRDDVYRQFLADWLDGAAEMLGHVRRAGAEHGPVPGADDLAVTISDTHARLADWRPARLSAAVGLREIQLDAAAAAELDRVLAAPPRPVPDGLRPVPITADELRRLRAAGAGS